MLIASLYHHLCFGVRSLALIVRSESLADLLWSLINTHTIERLMAAAGELFPVDENGLPRVAELSAEEIRMGFRLFFLNKQKVCCSI